MALKSFSQKLVVVLVVFGVLSSSTNVTVREAVVPDLAVSVARSFLVAHYWQGELMSAKEELRMRRRSRGAKAGLKEARLEAEAAQRGVMEARQRCKEVGLDSSRVDWTKKKSDAAGAAKDLEALKKEVAIFVTRELLPVICAEDCEATERRTLESITTSGRFSESYLDHRVAVEREELADAIEGSKEAEAAYYRLPRLLRKVDYEARRLYAPFLYGRPRRTSLLPQAAVALSRHLHLKLRETIRGHLVAARISDLAAAKVNQYYAGTISLGDDDCDKGQKDDFLCTPGEAFLTALKKVKSDAEDRLAAALRRRHDTKQINATTSLFPMLDSRLAAVEEATNLLKELRQREAELSQEAAKRQHAENLLAAALARHQKADDLLKQKLEANNKNTIHSTEEEDTTTNDDSLLYDVLKRATRASDMADAALTKATADYPFEDAVLEASDFRHHRDHSLLFATFLDLVKKHRPSCPFFEEDPTNLERSFNASEAAFRRRFKADGLKCDHVLRRLPHNANFSDAWVLFHDDNNNLDDDKSSSRSLGPQDELLLLPRGCRSSKRWRIKELWHVAESPPWEPLSLSMV